MESGLIKKEEFFKLIEQKRKEKKLTLDRLAELIEVNSSTLKRNLKGHTEMLLITAINLCIVLDIELFRKD